MGKAYSSLRDFKPHTYRRCPTRKPRQGFWLLSGIVCALTVVTLFASNENADATAVTKTALTANVPAQVNGNAGGHIRKPLTLPIKHAHEGQLLQANYIPTAAYPNHRERASTSPNRVAEQQQPPSWKSTRVRQGESLSLIFSRLGFSARELHDILALGKPASRLKRIYPDDELRYQSDSNGHLLALSYRYDDEHSLSIQRRQTGYTAKIIDHPIEHRQKYATAIINDSLFLAAQKTGLSDRLTMELAAIFGWDIDFVLDIRKGDEFTLIYEELYQQGEKLRDGAILAAEFVNRGKTFRAIRFSDGHYYSAEGNSLRKAFLRTPVNFTRISSRFSRGRKHPILHHIRAHHGVDYAAPSGTPIKATGDGRITFKGRKGGYGRVIVIQHGSRYSTLYAHMSRYRRGMRSGRRVKQGDTIGYVGKSGLATGPHLHYEFRVNGVHRNPLTVKLPDAQPLKKTQMARFKSIARPLLAQLDILKQTTTQLAER